MHQAIEAKGVEIKAENQTLATITLQNYFRLYDKLAGMTGTAETEAAEFHEIYKLGVVPIPTNKPMIRKDRPHLQDRGGQVRRRRRRRRRTPREGPAGPDRHDSVERSEYLSRKLAKRASHHVLNAKYHEQEARSSPRPAASAPSPSPPTWPAAAPTSCSAATRLHRRHALRKAGLDPVETPEEYEAAWTRRRHRPQAAASRPTRSRGRRPVRARHRAPRVAPHRQPAARPLRPPGRPGESRFYLSLGDELMRRFNGAALETIMTRVNLPDDVPIEAKMVTRAIKSAQTQVEQQNFEIRKNVLKYDEVMNQQRKVIYAERREILEGEDTATRSSTCSATSSRPTSTAPPPRATPRTGTSRAVDGAQASCTGHAGRPPSARPTGDRTT
jgi:preprotein translocase subunit SecA